MDVRVDRRSLIRAALGVSPFAAATADDVFARAAGGPEALWARLIPAPLKARAPFFVGACVSSGARQDPGLVGLVRTNFSQVTAEWEMKMEAILRDDGGFDFARSDAVAGFAAENGLRLHGHTLIWYAQTPSAFVRIDQGGRTFANAYRNYIAAVAGRYRGRVSSWDVVNEAVRPDGEGLRDCLWRSNLGDGYIADAFHLARESDPAAVLFLNDYDLETSPSKRRAFLRLAEQLLTRGAPLGGLGAQTHIDVALPPGRVGAAIKDLAALGLPIHISEFDVSTRVPGLGAVSPQALSLRQASLVHETVEHFMALPRDQRFAITVWGVRDRDSWLRRPPNPPGVDRPLLFDDEGREKLAAGAFLAAL